MFEETNHIVAYRSDPDNSQSAVGPFYGAPASLQGIADLKTPFRLEVSTRTFLKQEETYSNPSIEGDYQKRPNTSRLSHHCERIHENG